VTGDRRSRRQTAENNQQTVTRKARILQINPHTPTNPHDEPTRKRRNEHLFCLIISNTTLNSIVKTSNVTQHTEKRYTWDLKTRNRKEKKPHTEVDRFSGGAAI